jgi:type V secretory pathway adhesin AidA
MRRPLLIVALTFCAAVVFAAGTPAGVTTAAATAAAQCRSTDRIIPKQLRFARGRTTAVIKDTVRLCTMHEYYFRARAGQKITAHLATGNRTSMTLFTENGETVFDGTKDFEGELPEGGQYSLQIGTDVTAAYTLEITIR